MRRKAVIATLALLLGLCGCGLASAGPGEKNVELETQTQAKETEPGAEAEPEAEADAEPEAENEPEPEPTLEPETEPEPEPEPTADELYAALDISQDYRDEFDHGPKDAEHQRYIVLHDTEGEGDPESVVSWWSSSGNLVAAHFVVGKDGHIVQCVPLDRIAHHAGYGDTGHNGLFGIEEDGRDDMAGSVPIGSSYADYGMNAWSVGIELVHVGGSGDYPPEQLEALDGLIAYIDAYYGFESEITDHKAWRTGNSDTSPEFAGYLANYQDHRTHE